MPEFLQIVSALKEQMSASLSRSDALRPLSWLLGMLLFSFLGCIVEKPDTWITVCVVIALGLGVSLYFAAYFFFAVKDPDALRSERYTLNKMAIEHGWRGDSLTGPIQERETPPAQVPLQQVIGFDGERDG